MVSVEHWPSHKAGQFAFISKKSEKGEVHPFTIASSWQSNNVLRFLIKGLGDYTNQLTGKFKQGDNVYIEGPYGGGDFNDDQAKQIWIATGIGITPFISRLEELKENPTNQNIYLYYCHSQHEEILINELKNKAMQASVNFILWNSKEQGYLSAKHIFSICNNLTDTSIWFCGHTEMGRNLRNELVKLGLGADKFHQELFEIR